MTEIIDPLPSAKGKTIDITVSSATNVGLSFYSVPTGKIFYFAGATLTVTFGTNDTGENGQFLIATKRVLIINSNLNPTNSVTAEDSQTTPFVPAVPLPFPAGTAFAVSSSSATTTAYITIFGWEEDA